MIIQVCGKIIDTNFIYEITETKTTFEGVGDYEYERYCVSGGFKIKFVNEKEIIINKNGYGSHKTMHTPEYKLEESKISKQLNDVRDQLICKWKANQLVITKIEFDEK